MMEGGSADEEEAFGAIFGIQRVYDQPSDEQLVTEHKRKPQSSELKQSKSDHLLWPSELMLMTSGWLRWMRNEDEDGVSLSEAVVDDEVRFHALQLLMYAQSNLLVSLNGFNLP